MQCFELLDDAKKKISVDLTNKNPQYAMISFTSKNRPSTNKLWDRMGQVVVKANGEWVRLDVEVDGKGQTKTVYMCACIKPTCLSIYVYNSQDGTSSMSGHTYLHTTTTASSSNNLTVWASKRSMPTDSAKANMTNALVNMCSWDIHPFVGGGRKLRECHPDHLGHWLCKQDATAHRGLAGVPTDRQVQYDGPI
jgi:hypothetical protein